jgi:hypothetical protein
VEGRCRNRIGRPSWWSEPKAKQENEREEEKEPERDGGAGNHGILGLGVLGSGVFFITGKMPALLEFSFSHLAYEGRQPAVHGLDVGPDRFELGVVEPLGDESEGGDFVASAGGIEAEVGGGGGCADRDVVWVVQEDIYRVGSRGIQQSRLSQRHSPAGRFGIKESITWKNGLHGRGASIGCQPIEAMNLSML